MESTKRKAAAVALGEYEGRSAKRLKGTAEVNTTGETVQSTTTAGLKFLDSLRQAKDKTGRPIASHFLTLPDKDELPDYYDFIKLPIAIDTIEEKLSNGEYTSLAQVESDCKRLVNNAKSYNDKKSIIYEDAERLRKTASNWMVKHNPAYGDRNYVAVATPIPGEDSFTPAKSRPRVVSTPRTATTTAGTSSSTERPRRRAATSQSVTPAPSKLRNAAGNEKDEDEDEEEDYITEFAGKSFQQAQEQIIRGIMEYEEEGVQIFTPFVNLPSRALKDYYQVIKDPMSLAAVQKKVKGVIGREQPTGNTLFKSWDDFGEAISLIWRNARVYNEDGSDIYNLSQELEKTFHRMLSDARSAVDEPVQPKLKLNMSSAGSVPRQQLKLKLRQSPASDRNTPGPRTSTTPSIMVDNEALQRQQRHVHEGMNGTKGPTKAGTPVASSNPLTEQQSVSTVLPMSVHPMTNGAKSGTHSPALSAVRPVGTGFHSQSSGYGTSQTQLPIMAPPNTLNRRPSGGPYLNGAQPAGYHSQQAQTYYVSPNVPRVDNSRKVPLLSINDALIPKITLKAHPALDLPKPWSVDVLASKQKSSHSATIVVSPTYNYIQITPKVPIALTNRLYRLFVTVNGTRTLEVNRVPVTAGINGTNPGPGYEGGKKKGEPVFEAKLIQGVNRIEVELVAEKEHKDQRESQKPNTQVEVEKCTIFLNLMRHSS